MGLDFSRSDARWGYPEFNAFRKKLAAEIDINLDEMEGFCAQDDKYGVISWGEISWDTVSDPIKPLLNHSDCDGILTPEECAVVAPRLVELVSEWDAEDYDRVMANKLAAGMQDCAREGIPLEFC